MKKWSSPGCPRQTVMSVMLAIALVFLSIPMARAEQITLQASGVVSQNVISNEAPGVLLAHVTEGELDWEDDLNGNLNVFVASNLESSNSGKLEPGSSGKNSYAFRLTNAYTQDTKTIAYNFRLEVVEGKNVPIAYTLKRTPKGGAAETVAGARNQDVVTFGWTAASLNDVPDGDWVDFELDWVWTYSESTAHDNEDNTVGIYARENGPLKHAVKLEFYIEAAKPASGLTLTFKDSASNTVYDTWPGLMPGMSLSEAVVHAKKAIPTPTKSGHTFKGFKDKNGILIVNEKGEIVAPAGYAITEDMELYAQWDKNDDGQKCNWLPRALGIGGIALGAGGLVIGGLTIPWLIAIPALPVIGVVGWLLHKNCHSACGKTGCPKCECGKDACKSNDVSGYVPPPKTGDSWELPIMTGICMLLAAGCLIAMLQRRKREAY